LAPFPRGQLWAAALTTEPWFPVVDVVDVEAAAAFVLLDVVFPCP
jgi:hypothetical protein